MWNSIHLVYVIIVFVEDPKMLIMYSLSLPLSYNKGIHVLLRECVAVKATDARVSFTGERFWLKPFGMKKKTQKDASVDLLTHLSLAILLIDLFLSSYAMSPSFHAFLCCSTHCLRSCYQLKTFNFIRVKKGKSFPRLFL